MNKKIKMILAVMSLSLMLCACGSGLTGTYSNDTGTSYTFYNDGTLISSGKGGTSYKGTYQKNSDGTYDLFIDAGLFSTSGTFFIEDDVLIVTIGEREYQYSKE